MKIVDLIESGRGPSSLLLCLTSCATGLSAKDCQKCLEKELASAYGEKPCTSGDDDDDDDKEDDEEDDDKGRAPPDACSLLKCEGRTCGGDA